MEKVEKTTEEKINHLLQINIDRYLEFLDKVIQAPDRITEIKTRLHELYEPENGESFFSESYRSKLDNPEIKELEAEKETLQELENLHEVADLIGYRMMTKGEFSALQIYRKNALKIDIEQLDKEFNASIIPIDAIIEDTIKSVIEDRYDEYFGDFVTGPRPVLVRSKLEIVDFQAFVNLVDFVHYLDQLRNQKSSIKPGTLNERIMLLQEVGFFDLEKVNALRNMGRKRDQIFAWLLGTDETNTRKAYLAIREATKKNNPHRHKGILEKLLGE